MTRNRWLDWQPKAQIFSESPKGEPTKRTKPGFDGFVGATPAHSQKIEPEPDPLPANPVGIPWADWQAARLNRLFAEQGRTREPGRITADAVRHGERRRRWIN